MACYSPLKGWKNLETGGIQFNRQNAGEKMEVACGQCLGCRTDRVSMWAMRLTHEAAMHEDSFGNCFVTLTYRDKDACTEQQYIEGHYMPEDGSLRKDHPRNFVKRLRKKFPQKIKFFTCGEYGEKTWRPHYHLCLFNIRFDDLVVFKDVEGMVTYESETLAKLWPYGFTTVSDLTYDSAAYTAGYCLKKITGLQAQEHYLRCDDYGVAYWLQPEFVTMSLKPAIGKRWYEKFKDDVFPSDETPIPGTGRISKKVPRYYETILAEENPSLHKVVKDMRQKFIAEHGEDFTPERLEDKYKVHKAKNSRRVKDAI